MQVIRHAQQDAVYLTGRDFWTDGPCSELDLPAVTEWAKALRYGSKVIFDFEARDKDDRFAPAWNFDINRGPIDGWARRMLELIAAVRAADNGIECGFYEFVEGWYVLADNLQPHLSQIQAANDAQAAVIDACDFAVCKFYINPGTPASDVGRVFDAYLDERLRSARGKPIALLLAGMCHAPATPMSAAVAKAQADAVWRRRADFSWLAWWADRPADNAVAMAATMQAEAEQNET